MTAANVTDDPGPAADAVPMGRRTVAATVVVIAAMVVGYHSLGQLVDPARAVTLATTFDRWVPFQSWSIYAYALVYSCALYPLFAVRCERLFLRIARANAALLAVSFAIYLAFPVTSTGLRHDAAQLDPSRFAEWGVLLTYFLDPPLNCFPSLHLGFATLAMVAAGTARPLWGWVALPVVAAVFVSVLLMKQHYLADGVAGSAIALALWAWLIAPARTDPAVRSGRAARTWRGPLAYLGVAAAVYGGFFALYAAAWRPWLRV